MTQRQIAVIGLGNIGGGVAANLVKAGEQVTVVDLDAAKVDALAQLGATTAADPLEAVAEAHVVFTSLPGPKHIAAVGLGDGDEPGILSAMNPGAIWVELSTNDLDTARSLYGPAADAGIGIIDAPVSGGPEGAQAGTLSVYVGGETDNVEKVRELLHIIGDKVDHLGPNGAGIVAKIAQVTLCYTQTITLIEALLLGVKGGVQPTTMLDLIQNSAGRSYVSESYGPEILAGTYDASFPISHAAKDMRLAMSMATSVGADLPFMARVAELYEQTEARYGAAAPHLLAAQMLEDQNDLVLHEYPSNDTATKTATNTATNTETKSET